MSVFTRNDRDTAVRPATTTPDKPEVSMSTSLSESNRVSQPVQPVSHLTPVQSGSTSGHQQGAEDHRSAGKHRKHPDRW